MCKQFEWDNLSASCASSLLSGWDLQFNAAKIESNEALIVCIIKVCIILITGYVLYTGTCIFSKTVVLEISIIG